MFGRWNRQLCRQKTCNFRCGLPSWVTLPLVMVYRVPFRETSVPEGDIVSEEVLEVVSLIEVEAVNSPVDRLSAMNLVPPV